MIKTILLILLTFLIGNPTIPFESSDIPKANPDRILKHIQGLSQYGKDSRGGTSRVAFSQADVDGRTYFMELMRKVGLEVQIDYAGNIIGRRPGKNPELPPIVFGSHIDTVPNGGNYDGCVGSVGALEVMTLLFENNLQTDHPLEMILFSDEEGGLTGSRALIGELPAEALEMMSHSKKNNW